MTNELVGDLMSAEQLEQLSEFIDVNDLMARCMGNVDFATRIVVMLRGRCEDDIQQLQQASSNADPEAIAELSHRLKGALASSAAHELSRQADELCCSARDGEEREVSDRVAALRRQWDQLAAIIDGLKKS